MKVVYKVAVEWSCRKNPPTCKLGVEHTSKISVLHPVELFGEALLGKKGEKGRKNS